MRSMRWYGHLQCQPIDAPVRRGVLYQEEDIRSRRGRRKITLEKVVQRALKGRNIIEDTVVVGANGRIQPAYKKPIGGFTKSLICCHAGEWGGGCLQRTLYAAEFLFIFIVSFIFL